LTSDTEPRASGADLLRSDATARPERPARIPLERLAAVALLLAVFVALYIPFCRTTVPEAAGVLNLIWIVPAALLFGVRGGFSAALLSLPINAFLTAYVTQSTDSGTFPRNVPGMLAAFASGVGVGWLRDLVLRSRFQAGELRTERARLEREIAQREQVERDLRSLNAELEQAREMAVRALEGKSAFLGRMSHELRTPLASIVGYAELLQEESAAGAPRTLHADLGRILSASRHLMGLIEDLLDLSRIEAQKLRVNKESFELALLVEDVMQLIRPLAARNGNELQVDLSRAPAQFLSDPRRLRQILINLLGNATKFTSRGAITLSVSVVHRELAGTPLPSGVEWIEFRVADTGVGIDPEEVASLFGEFYQTSSGRQLATGTGLGLSITRRLCELLGGRLTVQSSVGEGSVFSAFLPSR
jgi:signal transduction histidine kinase